MNESEFKSYKKYYNFLNKLAKELTNFYYKKLDKPFKVTNKLRGKGYDPVTTSDKAFEKFIRLKISKKFPTHQIIGEEYGHKNTDSKYSWVIDPIDGTRSYVVGNPSWSNLISLNYDGEPVLGLANFPKMKKYYLNVNQNSAYVFEKNKKKKLKINTKVNFKNAKLAAAFHNELSLKKQSKIKKFISRMQFPCFDALTYCQLAEGRIEIVAQCANKIWDIHPIIPIVRAAGAIITTWDNKNPIIGGNILVSNNKRNHKECKCSVKTCEAKMHRRAMLRNRKEKAKKVEKSRSDFGIRRVRGEQGVVEPYPLNWIIRGFGKCVKGKRKHPAVDIAGVGPKYGLGTPIRSMARSQVLSIHLPEHNPARYGTRDKREGVTRRFGTALPRAMKVQGYGKVRFFTTDLGSARTGVMIVTKATEGRLKDHIIRYMHLGAIHPKLKVGSVLNPGQELGVMGSTAILESVPHVHIDITDPRSKRINVAKLLGFDIPVEPCGSTK